MKACAATTFVFSGGIMKTICIFLIGLFLLACGKPAVKEVPITEPWQTMELPMDYSTKVWSSDAEQIKLVYSASKEQIIRSYTDNLQTHGWVITSKKKTPNQYIISFAKGNVVLEVEIYDFEKTGVTIRRVV